MISREISDKILTIGPSPKMKGGIAQVLDTYFSEVFESPKFIPETVNGNKIKRVLTSVFAAPRLAARLITDRKIKIVHMHTASGISFKRSNIYASIARFFGKKTVMHIHGAQFKDFYRSYKASIHAKLSKCDAVVALSDSWRDFFTKEVELDNCVAIPNIVGSPVFSAVQESNGNINALFLGQLGQRKGIYDLLTAIHCQKERLKGRFMLHIGGNGETEKVKETISALGIDEMVKFYGWVSGEKKHRLLADCKLYILPSYAEGLPISILEAMAYRQAIISTPVGGIHEVVDETNGIIVQPGNITNLGEALVWCCDNSPKLEQMRLNSAKKVAANLPDQVSLKLNNLYQTIDKQ